MALHEMNMDEKWFDLIVSREKTVEGRLYKGKFKKIRVGDLIRIRCGEQFVDRRIKYLEYYDSFYDMLVEEIEDSLPGVGNVLDGVRVYMQYYTQKEEKEYGVIVIGLE